MSAIGARPTEGAVGRARAQARLAAVQALFQVQQGDDTVEEVVDQFLSVRSREAGEAGMPAEADRAFFAEVVAGAALHSAEIEPMLARSLGAGWTMARLDRLVRAVLQGGVFELRYRREIPARVIINEYVEIAHAFYGAREPGFVNSVLDRLARELRPQEFGAAADNA